MCFFMIDGFTINQRWGLIALNHIEPLCDSSLNLIWITRPRIDPCALYLAEVDVEFTKVCHFKIKEFAPLEFLQLWQESQIIVTTMIQWFGYPPLSFSLGLRLAYASTWLAIGRQSDIEAFRTQTWDSSRSGKMMGRWSLGTDSHSNMILINHIGFSVFPSTGWAARIQNPANMGIGMVSFEVDCYPTCFAPGNCSERQAAINKLEKA